MKAYEKYIDEQGVSRKRCECGSDVAIAFDQTSVAVCRKCKTRQYFCMHCLEVVSLDPHEHFKGVKNCAACGSTECVPHSLSDVYKEYPGYLAVEIIEARSNLNVNANSDQGANDVRDTTDGGGSDADAGRVGGVLAGSKREGVAHAE